jgi:two-component system sensor histidine kinase ChvG
MEKKLGLKPGRITLKLLLGNLLLVFLPWFAILSLDTYESQLLVSLEKTLVQQGRFAAAGLGTDPRALEIAAPAFLDKLAGRHEARIRVVNPEGRLLADSALFGPQPSPEEDYSLSRGGSLYSVDSRTGEPRTQEPSPEPEQRAGDSWLYQLGTAPVRLYRWLFTTPRTGVITDPYPPGALLEGPEIQAALAGRYGAITRITPGDEASVTLYSAIPIYNGAQAPIGAVLVNQSTYRILVDLYELRLDVFRLSLLSLLAALLITIYLELSIARPLIRITTQSKLWGGSRGPLQSFPLPPQPEGRNRPAL